jgi:hypothetical protein
MGFVNETGFVKTFSLRSTMVARSIHSRRADKGGFSTAQVDRTAQRELS